MGKVRFDITMSLDGFIAGPNDGPEHGLGEGGEQLHQWVYDLASWREPHGLAGGVTKQDSEIRSRKRKPAEAGSLKRGGLPQNPPPERRRASSYRPSVASCRSGSRLPALARPRLIM